MNNKTYCFPFKEIITTSTPTTEFIKPSTHIVETTQIIETTHLIDTTQNIITTELMTELKTIPVLKKCTYYAFLEGLCQYLNLTNYLILNELIPDLIETYPNSNGSSLIIKGEDNITFQITTEKNENDLVNNYMINIQKLSVLDLNGCNDILRETYSINPNDSLIILKVEKITSKVQEKNIQYEIYHPATKKQLDISICNNIDLNIPITLSKDKENLYKKLQEYGYDLLDSQDSFYQDICSKYKSENGTDVILSDRKNDFYDYDLSCQDNCKYSSYSDKTKYLKCECKIDNKNITLEKFKDFVYESFASFFKYSNYKFIKCYKLVFHINSITKNIGSIILIILFLLQIIILIIYIIKGIKPLKIDIIKIIDNYKNPKKSLLIRKPLRMPGREKRKKIKETLLNLTLQKKELNQVPILIFNYFYKNMHLIK